MSAESTAVETLRDGNVFFALDNERMYRVHRARPISWMGQPWVELIVRDLDLPLTPLRAMIYPRGKIVPIAIHREK